MTVVKRGKALLAVVFIALAMSACKRHSGPEIDDPAPVAALQNFQGKAVHLPMDMKGKVWLLRFWSLECGFCDKELLPGLETLYQKYKDQGFVPVAINVGEYDPGDERWKRFESLTYPMLIDERGIVAKKFGVIGMPTTYIIDREGVLREKVVGEAGLNELEQLFTTVLK